MEKQWKDAMAQLLGRAVDTESSNAVVKAQGYVTKPKLTQSDDVEVGNRSSEFCFHCRLVMLRRPRWCSPMITKSHTSLTFPNVTQDDL